jgi:hypothetical protein
MALTRVKFNDNVTINGNVGVSTSSFNSKLEVKGPGANGTVRVIPASANAEASIGYYQDTTGSNMTSRWVAGVGGWGHTNQFVIGNSDAAKLKISTAGYVLMPYQPAFRANAKSGQAYGTGWQKVIYDLAVSTRGTGYNGTTSTFTAPVDGWYQFNCQWTADSNADVDGTLSLWINNSASDLAGTSSMPDTGPNYEGHVVSGACYLAANDYVAPWRYSSVTNTTRTAAPYGGWFSGFLIG